MEIQVWFEATEAGEYPIGCAELCGNGHTRMRGTLIVHEQAAYQQWLQERTAPPAAAPATAPAGAPAPATPGAPPAP
jgi:cytochrome c oxidase subunit 2